MWVKGCEMKAGTFGTLDPQQLPNYPTFGEFNLSQSYTMGKTHPFSTGEGPSILCIVGDLLHTSRNTYLIHRYTLIFAFAYNIFTMEHSLHDISRTLSVKVIKVDATFQTLTITLPIHVWSSISYYFPSIAINWPKSDLALIFPNLQTQKKTVSWTLRNLMNLRTDPRWFVLVCRSGFRPKAVNMHRSRRFFVGIA